MLSGKIKKQSEIAKIIASIHPDQIFGNYIKTSEDRKAYFDALKSLSSREKNSREWVNNVIDSPDFLAKKNISKSEKNKIINLTEELHSSSRRKLLQALQGVEGFDFFQMASLTLGQEREKETTVEAKEKKMKALILQNLGKNKLNSIESHMTQSMNNSERLHFLLQSASEAYRKNIKKSQKYETVEEFEKNALQGKNFIVGLITIAGFPSEIKNQQLHRNEENFDKLGLGISAIKTNNKKGKLEYLHGMNELERGDREKTIKQIHILEKRTAKEIIPSFANASLLYQKSQEIILEKFPNFYYEIIPANDPRIEQVFDELNKIPELSLPRSSQESFSQYLAGSNKDFPPAYLFDFGKNLQQKFSTENHNLPKNTVHKIVSGDLSQLATSLPASIIHSTFKNQGGPTNALLKIYKKNFDNKTADKISGKIKSHIVAQAEHLEMTEFGMDESELAAKRIKEKHESNAKTVETLTTQKIPFLLKKLESGYKENPSEKIITNITELQYISRQLSAGIKDDDSKRRFEKRLGTLVQKGDISSISEGARIDDTLLSAEKIIDDFTNEIGDLPAQWVTKRIEEISPKSKEERINDLNIPIDPNSRKNLIENFTGPDGIDIIFSSLGTKNSLQGRQIKKLLDLRTPNSDKCIQKISSISDYHDQKTIDKYLGNHDGSIFMNESGMIFLKDEVYETLQRQSLDPNSTTPAEILNSLKHESFHMMIDSVPETLFELKNIFPKGFFEELIQNRTARLGDKIISLGQKEGRTHNIANETEEIFAHMLAGKQFPPNMEYLLRDLENYAGSENIKNILENAQRKFPGHYSERNKKYGGGGSKNQSIGGSVEEIDPESKNPKAKESYIPLENRQNHVDQMEAYTKEMNNILEDFKRFKSKVKGEDKKRLDGWDQYYRDRMEEDKNMIQSSPNLTQEKLDKILKSYTTAGKDDGPKNELNRMMVKLSEATIGDRGFFKEAWSNTTFLSMADIGKMWDTTWEYIKRQHERKSRKRTGTAGASMFDGILNGLSNEFAKDDESAKKEEVSNIKDGMTEMSAETIYSNFLPKVRNPDQLEAAMEELSDRGLLNWNDPIFGKILHKLGSGITFYPSDYENYEVRDKKYQIALDRVFADSDRFHEVNAKNDSSLKQNVDKWKGESESKINSLTLSLDSWIRNKRKGLFVDPLQYEGYINSLKEFGKGDPASPLYYIIIGIAEGIITVDTAKRFDAKYINDYAFSQMFFTDPSLEQVKGWEKEILYNSETNEYAKPESGVPTNFRSWVHRVVFNDEKVLERVIANQGAPQKIDHDHAMVLLSTGSASSVKSLLAESSTGGQLFKKTAYNNIVAGMLNYTTSLASQRKIIPQEQLKKNIMRQFGYFTAFDGMSSGRTHNDRQRFKFDDGSLNAPPREGGSYNERMNTKSFIDANREIFSAIPKGTFKNFLDEIVFNQDLSSKYSEKINETWNTFKINNPEIKKVLEDSSIQEPDEKGESLYADLIPTVIRYFMDKDDKYLESILNKAEEISAAKGEYAKGGQKDWGSNFNPAVNEKAPPPSRPHNPKSVSNYEEIFGKQAA